MRFEYYEQEAHGRFITVCVGIDPEEKDIFNDIDIWMGMSIASSVDISKLMVKHNGDKDLAIEEVKKIGRLVSKGRLKKAKEGGRQTSKSKCVIYTISRTGIDPVLVEDRFFLRQIAKSFYFDFKHNPEKYIAAYET